MTGEIYLGGGGSGEQTATVDSDFFRGVKSVLYVPLAWPNDDFNSCLEWFKGTSKDYGERKIEMLTNWTDDRDLSKFDAVYICIRTR